MLKIYVTQVKTLAQYKILCQSQDATFSELKICMDLLASEVHDLKSENVLHKDLVAPTGYVKVFKASGSLNVNLISNLLYELAKREKCSRNIIVHEISKVFLPLRLIESSMTFYRFLKPFGHFSRLYPLI